MTLHKENLGAYLRDHLAGSVAGIEILKDLAATAQNTDEARLLNNLGLQVERDQEQLKNVLDSLDQPESALKKAGAWIAEKVLLLKARGAGTPFGRLEALEVILLGVQGKLSLWRTLETLPAMSGWPDLTELEKRAREQLDVLEGLRLATARAAFAGTTSDT